MTDAATRREIGEYYRQEVGAYLGTSVSAYALFADDPARSTVQRRIGGSVAYLGEHMGDAPVVVIPCITAPHLDQGSQAGLWGSLLPGVWSFMLAARAGGLGTAWTTLHLSYEQGNLGSARDTSRGEARRAGPFRPAPRQPLDDVLHVNGS